MRKIFKRVFGLYVLSPEEIEDLLRKQREICGETMDMWCKHNGIQESGHIVQYIGRPNYEELD